MFFFCNFDFSDLENIEILIVWIRVCNSFMLKFVFECYECLIFYTMFLNFGIVLFKIYYVCMENRCEEGLSRIRNFFKKIWLKIYIRF